MLLASHSRAPDKAAFDIVICAEAYQAAFMQVMYALYCSRLKLDKSGRQMSLPVSKQGSNERLYWKRNPS